jgi:DNA-binding IclR family transcriptional regulator
LVDRLDAMSVLVMRSETGSFSAASRRLGAPLSTVSRKVSELSASRCAALDPFNAQTNAHRRSAAYVGL